MVKKVIIGTLLLVSLSLIGLVNGSDRLHQAQNNSYQAAFIGPFTPGLSWRFGGSKAWQLDKQRYKYEEYKDKNGKTQKRKVLDTSV